jgi:hypothetical protein
MILPLLASNFYADYFRSAPINSLGVHDVGQQETDAGEDIVLVVGSLDPAACRNY